MRKAVAVLLSATAGLLLGGCVPVGLAVVSMSVDTVLLLRTQKTATDHIASTIVDLDCGVGHLLQEGRYCLDSQPPSLIAELNRDEAAEQTRRAIAATQTPSVPIQIAARPEAVAAVEPPQPVAKEVPKTVAAPERRTVHAKTVVVATPPSAPATPAVSGPLAVVVGSYLSREEAERRRTQVGLPNAEITEATVEGRLFHRVVLRAESRAGAVRTLKEARTGGIRDAWLLAMPVGGSSTPNKDAVQTAELTDLIP